MRRFVLFLLASCALVSPSLANQRIGSAASIENDVRGAISGREERLAVGNEIYADEVLTTGVASRGKFVFDDRTDLQMGPSSRLKLDSFVYSGNSGVSFNAAKGVFRFISAPGGHKDYHVRTPTATIGVRGTTFGVRASRTRTDAVLVDGVIEVCRANGGSCRVLDVPCTTVTVTAGGVTRPKAVGSNDWTFDGSCKPGRQGGNEPPRSIGGPPPSPPDDEPPVDWSGFSFGFNAGTAIGAAEFADPIPLHGAAFQGGPKLGYNWRLTPNIIAGFEADAEYRSEIGGGSNGLGWASNSRGGYLGTFRARIGYAFDRWLVFGTGGLAYGHIIAPKSFSGFNVITAGYTAGTSQNNPFLPGWAAGGGVQYALTDNLSVKAEYLYVKLQHDLPLYSTNVTAYPVGVCNISGLHSIRLGVSYGFSLKDLAAAAGGN
jgi:outer membrane immunogenic protein